MRKKWISFLCFVTAAVCCNAQTAGYKFYARLDSVKTSGFYNIAITPELSAHLKTDYSDLRIVNDSGKWVPHVLHYPATEKSDLALYMDLRIVKKETTGSFTTLVIAAGQHITSNLVLNIRNTTAERFCTLSGSDDDKDWFVINDSILINPASEAKNTTNSFRIDFPPSNYSFFKIVIDNKNKDPFDIKDVMNSTSASSMLIDKPKLLLNPPTIIEQKDSGKISYLKVTQQQSYHFNNISLKLSGVKYFSRKVDLYIPDDANHSVSNPGQLFQSFTISNNSTLEFKLPVTNAPIFYLKINNEDNLPLKVAEVNTSIDNRYITSYLEKGNKYRLIMENASATEPNYDLTSINIKFSDSTPLLSFKNIIAFKEKPTVASPQKNNSWILWVSLIAVLFVLLLFTQKMVKEVNKRKEHDSI
jgi:hypothetical protein